MVEWNSIPQYLLTEIMKKLPPLDLINVCQINKNFSNVCDNEAFMKFKLTRDYPRQKKPNDQTQKRWYFWLTLPTFMTAELPMVNHQTGQVSLGVFTIKFVSQNVFLNFTKHYSSDELNSVILDSMANKYPTFDSVYKYEPQIDFSKDFRGNLHPDILVMDSKNYIVLTPVTTQIPERYLNRYIANGSICRSVTVGTESSSNLEIIRYIE